MIRGMISVRGGVAIVAFCGFAALGCNPVGSLDLTQESPAAARPRNDTSLPPAYQNSQVRISDPRVIEEAERFKSWALKERGPASPQPLFGHVEILPSTQTVMPYGVGAFQQEPRLPVILITGPGWAALAPEAKEALVSRAFVNLSGRLSALRLSVSPKPTLTIQTPSGLVLGWINDLAEGRTNLHGEEQ